MRSVSFFACVTMVHSFLFLLQKMLVSATYWKAWISGSDEIRPVSAAPPPVHIRRSHEKTLLDSLAGLYNAHSHTHFKRYPFIICR